MAASKIRPKASNQRSLAKPVIWLLIVGGVVGLISSFVLTLDKIEFLKNPSFVPNCDLNPVLSCGSVMISNQGDAFGFPNPWIGLAGFSVLITIGVAILAGATFKRWFWIGLEIGLALGLLFALWLLYESVYSINALCPYCLAVDVVVISLMWYTTLYLVEQKLLVLPKFLNKSAVFARKHHLDILMGVFALIFAIILKHFWYYYGQKL